MSNKLIEYFLKEKGILKGEAKEWISKFENGAEVSINKLIEEFSNEKHRLEYRFELKLQNVTGDLDIVIRKVHDKLDGVNTELVKDINDFKKMLEDKYLTIASEAA